MNSSSGLTGSQNAEKETIDQILPSLSPELPADNVPEFAERARVPLVGSWVRPLEDSLDVGLIRPGQNPATTEPRASFSSRDTHTPVLGLVLNSPDPALSLGAGLH